MDTGIRDRVVLVTGADNPAGIGAATARAFAREGAALFVTLLEGDEREGVVREIRDAGGRAHAARINLADPMVIPILFDAAERALGPVEVLVINAAHSETDSLLSLPTEARDWANRTLRTITPRSHDAHFAVNSRATALLMAEYARRSVQRGAARGRIIAISTDGAHNFPGEVSYGASKAALESYSRSAAGEFGPYGITVNIVSPGPIQTGWIPEELEGEIAATIPMGRVGHPEDVADAILLLASEQARWITGQTIHVGGGHRMA